MSTVTLSNEKTFSCEPGVTLLDSAKKQGVILEYSCRSGRCGVCKAQVVGETEVIHHHESVLSSEELASGYILTCCRSALSDVRLDIEDLNQFADIRSKTLPCRVDSFSHLADDVVEVVLRLPPKDPLNYMPGQYVDIIGKNGVRRSYSIANAPRQDGRLELQIRKVEGGVMSQYWFDELAANDLLRLEGPQGTFALRNTSPENLVFLATGTGIAPVKAILEQLKADPELAVNKKVWVYWGGRHAKDIYWQPELGLPAASFIPVLSRPDSSWVGRTGYVQDVLEHDGIDLADSVVYACGSEHMIQSAKEKLVTLGLPHRNFYSDAFVSSN
ncbi:FAD-binding oxidoreductase [Pseudomonas rhodesiae]|uniref:FAD-binding oxidoreductase n=1 Tax=Pseudomonas rhodesiae TaxID=76760 RepID=UPI000B8BC2C2|nr:FAD-binding oxidoreductase [Pseudomonas rhodesiae]OXS23022.1 NAD(P)H-flavin reductase [Pseudomonas fluorescens]OZO47463.1 NAD(P)H-flavin reductase [Pseudomonas fluorescens]TGY19861.1 2Fe-2S iron-sulfur cluster binding domain-containing protein [Pseudomonas fluorescens]WLG41127.1 FAD-binding oxidoreductase [Pseudomonas rhodesiae]